MKQRSQNWFSFGTSACEDPALITAQQASIFRFSLGSLHVAQSDDGWIRLRIALGPTPDERRSWAIDSQAEESRTWSALKIPYPTEQPAGPATRKLSQETEGVDIEGESNPHVDTRGLVEETVGGSVIRLPGPGPDASASRNESDGLSLFVARSRDGIRIDLPVATRAAVYGLGEKTGGLDKRGRTWAFWNTDDPTQLPSRDPLYQSIPVAYLFGPAQTLTTFSDSPATQYFDVCESSPDKLRIEVYDDQVDLYLRADDSLPSAVDAYTGLTGHMPMPPMWSLGFQQSRYSYLTDRRLLEMAERLRAERIPCDVVYLDIHYMDGYRVFTWNPERFPEPGQLLRSLRDQGFHVVTIIDPGVKADPDSPAYLDGLKQGAFLAGRDGRTYLGEVWPGAAVFPDFTDQGARHWWAEQHKDLLATGVDGIWNDMNEPSDFTGDPKFRPGFTVADDLIARNDGRPVSFGRVHNAYANGMNTATRTTLADQRPDERGFVLTRAGYAGIQRHAAVWTGDNHSWWEHLALMIPMQLNLGLSGVAFCGADTGGFQLNASPELYARWVAAACLMPFFRAHSALDTLDHEPWSFGPEVLGNVRDHIGLRYQLLPYLYTLFEESTCTGAPIMRPLIWAFPDDPRVIDRADSFLLGSSLLVAPVRERGVQERAVYLPAGGWYDFWTGEQHSEPGCILVEAPVGHLPLFVRAGSIIPYEEIRQHTGESGDGLLRLLVAPDIGASGRIRRHAQGTLYADRGEGHEYRSGTFWRAAFELDDDRVIVKTTGGQGAKCARWSAMAVEPVGRGLPVAPGNRVAFDPDGKTTEIEYVDRP